MPVKQSAVKTILLNLAGGGGAAVACYLSFNNLWVVNNVGLLHRLGFPWSSLPMWIAGGVAMGFAKSLWEYRRLRRHEEGFETLGQDAQPIVDAPACPRLGVTDEDELWSSDPKLLEMPPFREESPATRSTHQVSHRMTGSHRSQRLEVFDLTTEVRPKGEGSNQTIRRTVVILHESRFPVFALRPKTFWRRLIQSLGGGMHFDARLTCSLEDSETVSDFKKAYVLGSRDVLQVGIVEDVLSEEDEIETEARIRKLFTPMVMRTLNRWPGWSLESHSGRLALARRWLVCTR